MLLINLVMIKKYIWRSDVTLLNSPDWPRSRLATVPIDHRPDWLSSRLTTVPIGHRPNWPSPRLIIVSVDHVENNHTECDRCYE